MRRIRGLFLKYPETKPDDWSIDYVDAQGRQRREHIGPKGLAIKALAKRRTEAMQGKKLPETLRRRTVYFPEIADAAIAYVERKYARPADDVARLKVIKTWFECAADAITPDMIERRLDEAQDANRWSPSTRNHFHNLISLTFRLALRAGTVRESPIHRKVRKAPENNSRVRFLTADEEKKLRAVIRSKPEWAEHECELDLAANTGLRRGSMYHDLVWENMDLAARTLTIPRTKNGKPITLPLNVDAMKALTIFRSRGDGTGRVVRNTSGETLNVNAHWFVPAVRAAGIKDFRWHDLRHCFASRLRQAGVPLGNIAELLGHKGLAMTQRYAHLSISNLHDAVARIANSTCVAPEPISEPVAAAFVQ